MDYWKHKKVVITGGTGFVGTHLTKHLKELGANVHVLDLNMGKPPLPGVIYHLADARQQKDCQVVFDGAFAVFNLAAKVAGVEYNQNNNFGMLAENLPLQTVPVVAAKAAGVNTFVQISSVCIYPDGQTSPCDDMQRVHYMYPPNRANFGYAMAKRTGEIMADEADFEHCIIARPTNIYGPGDDFGPNGHVIPALIKRCINDDIIEVNGSGKEVREFIFVGDVVKALVHLAQFGDYGIFNIGTDGRTRASIYNLVQLIQGLTETEKKEIIFTNNFDSGDDLRYTDAKQLQDTGFTANTSLSDGLAKTVEWWRGVS